MSGAFPSCLALATLLSACSGPRGSVPVNPAESDTDTDVDTDTSGDTGEPSEPDPHTVSFEGALVTVTGEVFGVPKDTLQSSSIVGSFTYDAAAPDEDDDRSRYESGHAGTAFHADFAGATLDGSGDAVIRVVSAGEGGGTDCFYFEDGPQLGEEGLRHIFVNGVESDVATIWIALCDDDLGASGQAGPNPFVWLDPGMPHTFALEDGEETALVQLSSLAVE